MKRTLALLLALCLIAGLCGCGKKKKAEPEQTAPPAPTPTPNEIFEVKMSLDNLYTYFDYKEYRADVRDENTSEIDSSTIAYGLQLKPQFTAANDPAHKDTMALRFEAEGVVMSGDFQINFDDLSFTGTPATSERDAAFLAQGRPYHHLGFRQLLQQQHHVFRPLYRDPGHRHGLSQNGGSCRRAGAELYPRLHARGRKRQRRMTPVFIRIL